MAYAKNRRSSWSSEVRSPRSVLLILGAGMHGAYRMWSFTIFTFFYNFHLSFVTTFIRYRVLARHWSTKRYHLYLYPRFIHLLLTKATNIILPFFPLLLFQQRRCWSLRQSGGGQIPSGGWTRQTLLWRQRTIRFFIKKNYICLCVTSVIVSTLGRSWRVNRAIKA